MTETMSLSRHESYLAANSSGALCIFFFDISTYEFMRFERNIQPITFPANSPIATKHCPAPCSTMLTGSRKITHSMISFAHTCPAVDKPLAFFLFIPNTLLSVKTDISISHNDFSNLSLRAHSITLVSSPPLSNLLVHLTKC